MGSKSVFSFVVLFLLSVGSVIGQDDQVLDRSSWEKLRSEVEYKRSGSKSSNQPDSQNGNYGKDYSSDEESDGSSINFGGLAQLIILALFIAFIVALLYVLFTNAGFIRSNPKAPEDGVPENLEKIEDNFTRGNLEKWLTYAINTGDNYLIIRVRFLLILKKLEIQYLIRWKKEKTNWSYIQELQGHHYQKAFSELVSEYDELWYGEKKYSEGELRTKIERFESFEKNLISAK